MNPKITVITLGVNDLDKAFAFYQKGLGFPSKDGIQFDGDLRIAFFQLKGTWLSLFERALLAMNGGGSEYVLAESGLVDDGGDRRRVWRRRGIIQRDALEIAAKLPHADVHSEAVGRKECDPGGDCS